MHMLDAPSYTHPHMGSMCHIIIIIIMMMLSRVIGQRIMWVDASVLVGCMGCGEWVSHQPAAHLASPW